MLILDDFHYLLYFRHRISKRLAAIVKKAAITLLKVLYAR